MTAINFADQYKTTRTEYFATRRAHWPTLSDDAQEEACALATQATKLANKGEHRAAYNAIMTALQTVTPSADNHDDNHEFCHSCREHAPVYDFEATDYCSTCRQKQETEQAQKDANEDGKPRLVVEIRTGPEMKPRRSFLTVLESHANSVQKARAVARITAQPRIEQQEQEVAETVTAKAPTWEEVWARFGNRLPHQMGEKEYGAYMEAAVDALKTQDEQVPFDASVTQQPQQQAAERDLDHEINPVEALTAIGLPVFTMDEGDEEPELVTPRRMPLPDYSAKPNYEQFVREVEAAGYEVRHYRGRWFYEGPALTCDDLQEGIRATTVPVQWDNLGKGWIVYPC